MKTTETARRELGRVVELFERGEVGTAIAHVAIPPLDIPSSKWSYGNRLLVFMAGTSDARGIRQWNQAGRKVKRGTRAAYILVPMIIKTKTEDGKEESRCIGFKACPVFRVEDTEGASLPTYAPPSPPPLMDVAQSWGVDVRYIPFNGTHWGWCGAAGIIQ